MRRSKGFILAEILISMMLQAGFVIVLCGAFYLLVSFESDVQMKLVARQRGQRVIQYIDQRIRTAGLGFQECSYYQKEQRITPRGARGVREALTPLIEEGNKPLYNSKNSDLKLPVALSYSANDEHTNNTLKDATAFATSDDTANKIQYGNILTLLYAERDINPNVNLVISVETTPTSTPNRTRIDTDNPLGLTDDWRDDLAKDFIGKLDINFIKQSLDRQKANRTIKNIQNRYQNINRNERQYSISTSLLLVLINEYFSELVEKDKNKQDILWEKIRLIREKISDDVNNDKLLDIDLDYKYRFISKKDDEFDNSNFYKAGNPEQYIESYAVMAGTGIPFIVLKNTADPTKVILKFADGLEPGFDIHTGDELLYLKCQRMFVSGKFPDRNFVFQELTNDWSTAYPYQDGILEIFFTLNRNTNVLDLYVLSSGGKDVKIYDRPSAWPKKARWKDEYKYHVMYVSHASWKLENIPEGFNWNS